MPEILWNFGAAILAIMNPFGKVPLWLRFTGDKSKRVEIFLAVFTTSTAALILGAFLFFGGRILQFFDVDLASFRIAGGMFLLFVAFQMLNGLNEFDVEKDEEKGAALAEAKKRFNQILIPMTIPMLAGPGSISTMILYSFRAENNWERLYLLGLLVLFLGLSGAMFLASRQIQKVFGNIGMNVVTRIFGLILAAIAIQFVLEGFGEVFPGWIEPGSPLIEDLKQNQQATQSQGEK